MKYNRLQFAEQWVWVSDSFIIKRIVVIIYYHQRFSKCCLLQTGLQKVPNIYICGGDWSCLKREFLDG